MVFPSAFDEGHSFISLAQTFARSPSTLMLCKLFCCYYYCQRPEIECQTDLVPELRHANNDNSLTFQSRFSQFGA